MNVDISYDPDWRAPYWSDENYRREAWFVTCSDHPCLGKDRDGESWGYAAPRIAQMVRTRHIRAFHTRRGDPDAE
jgi:hypothetical protein